MTLTEFLLARIAEDEAMARAASSGPWVKCEGIGDDFAEVLSERTGKKIACEVEQDDADHISRHDPARVLAECEAKRRIVAMHAPRETEILTADDEENVTLCIECAFNFPCDTLRTIAPPYAGHPDYDPEWRA